MKLHSLPVLTPVSKIKTNDKFLMSFVESGVSSYIVKKIEAKNRHYIVDAIREQDLEPSKFIICKSSSLYLLQTNISS